MEDNKTEEVVSAPKKSTAISAESAAYKNKERILSVVINRRDKHLKTFKIVIGIVVFQVAFLIYSKTSSDAGLSNQQGNQVEKIPLAAKQTVKVAEIRFAIVQFKAKNGRFPSTMQELVPEFLAELPIDPVSKEAIVLDGNKGDIKLASAKPEEEKNQRHKTKSQRA